jgi:hypothetical protein
MCFYDDDHGKEIYPAAQRVPNRSAQYQASRQYSKPNNTEYDRERIIRARKGLFGGSRSSGSAANAGFMASIAGASAGAGGGGGC